MLHAEPGSGGPLRPGPPGTSATWTALAARPGEPVLTKTSHNAFTTTRLQQILTRRGISELVICGIRTEQCCETTARVASDLGYGVTFVTDATATTPIPHRDARRARSWPRYGGPAHPARPPTSSSAPSTPWPAGSRPSRSVADAGPAGRADAADRRGQADRIVTTVVFLLVPGVHLLDLAGPAQVLDGRLAGPPV